VLYPFRTDHPGYDVAKKQMTGGGTVVAMDLGSREAAFKFLNALEIVDISNNLGDAKSMATHPPTTTHRSVPEEQRPLLGVTEGGVRLSVGLESLADLNARCDPCARSGVKPPPQCNECGDVAARTARPTRPARATSSCASSRSMRPRNPRRTKACISGPTRSRSRTTAARQ
jgi:hypothetical protein